MNYYSVVCNDRVMSACPTLQSAKAYAKRNAGDKPQRWQIWAGDETWETILDKTMKAKWKLAECKDF